MPKLGYPSALAVLGPGNENLASRAPEYCPGLLYAKCAAAVSWSRYILAGGDTGIP
jgi:hypothetical protein